MQEDEFIGPKPILNVLEKENNLGGRIDSSINQSFQEAHLSNTSGRYAT